MKYTVKTFYAFHPLDESQISKAKIELEASALKMNVLGLLITGTEGFNTTLAAESVEQLDKFIQLIQSVFQIQETALIKTSQSDKRPFKRFDVKIRPEIVTIGDEQIIPSQQSKRHLSPDEWHELMQSEDAVVVDTRNTYETEIGKFKGAKELDIDEFREFPEVIKDLETDKDKPHLIYCTGGIRCEKAIYEMEKQGYTKVYQLEGGILNYIEQRPNEAFEGECFVFDSRVSLDQELKPSTKYSLCPHCGDVSSIDYECLKCDSPMKVCTKCDEKMSEDVSFQTCSKNCRHHYQLRPDKKGPKQKQYYHD